MLRLLGFLPKHSFLHSSNSLQSFLLLLLTCLTLLCPVVCLAAGTNMTRLPWPVWASLAANIVLFAAKLACYLTTRSLAVAASLVDSTVVREGLHGRRVCSTWRFLFFLVFSFSFSALP